MKLLITEEQYETILNEIASMDDYYSFYDEMVREFFNKINNQEPIKLRKIKPTQYRKALAEFVKYGEFMRFPTKYIKYWKSIMLENVAILDVLTSIHGHSQYFPYDEFYDTFDYSEPTKGDQYNLFTGDLEDVTPDGEFTAWTKKKYRETGDEDYLKRGSFTAEYIFLDEYKKIDNFVPFFENGHAVLSDFGLDPLRNLAEELMDKDDPNEEIVLINKMLDITHARSDLAEIFIEGGSASLDDIAGYERTPEYHGP